MLNRLALTLVLSACYASHLLAASPTIKPDYYKLPLAFERQGEGEQARYLARGNGYVIGLQGGAATIGIQPRPDGPTSTVSMQLVNSRAVPATSGPELPGKVNYIRGNDPRQWRLGLPTYEKITYPKVYPGIDLVYYGNQRQLEFDLVLHPGADPSQVRLRFDGARRLSIDPSGALVIASEAGEMRLPLPVVYQEVGGIRKPVEGRYALLARNEVRFAVGRYDRTAPLVIDPTIVYSVLAGGGNNSSLAQAIAVDSSDNAYIAGYTYASDFPTVNGVMPYQLNTDGFVSKINSSGTALLYSTYLGGSNYDYFRGIAVDSTGAAWVTGYSNSTDFPVANAYQSALAGTNYNAVVAKLSPSGALLFSSYFGTSMATTEGMGIATDPSGKAYITGYVTGLGLPVTAGAYLTTSAGGTDAFVAKFTATGALSYSTYLGGYNTDYGYGIAVDAGGNAYVTGQTYSSTFTNAPAGGAQPFVRSTPDAFVAKLNPAGSGLVYFTFLGGNSTDIAYGIAVDAGGNAYITGYTYSSDFPVTPGAIQSTVAGDSDAFVAKLNSTGTAFQYVTYLGGNANDYGYAIAVDSAGNAYVTGYTNSYSFPMASPIEGALPGTSSSLFQTANSGSSWTPMDGSIRGLVRSISPDPTSASTVVASTDAGTYRTTNGGQTWTAGVNGPANAYLARSPVSNNTIFAYSTNNNTSYLSTDGGLTWSTQGSFGSSATNIVADPLSATTAYWFSSNGGYYVYKTTNGGQNWFYANNGLPSYQINALVAASDGTLYASVYYYGIYKSIDGGLSWGAASSGLPSPFYGALNGLAVSASNPAVLYVSNGGTVVYRTANGGGTWTATNPLPNGATVLAAQPGNANAIAAASSTGVLYGSTDGGSTWSYIGGGLGTVAPSQIAFSAANSSVAFAVSSVRNAAFVSKINPSGTGLVYSTYLASGGSTYGYGIAVDSVGDAFATGYSYGAFPVTSTAMQGYNSQTEAFVVRISGATAACSYTVSPASQLFDSGSRITSFTVLAPSGCSWNAFSSNPEWANVVEGASSSGWGLVTVSMTYNNSGAARTAILTIGGQTVVLNQASNSCGYSVSATPNPIGAAGGAVQIGINTGSGCPWTAASLDPFAVTLGANTSGTGSGTIPATVAATTNPYPRTLTVRINNGYSASFVQSGTCSYTLSNTRAVFGQGGGPGSVTLTTQAGCFWTASSPVSWLTITAGGSGTTGTGTIYYSAATGGVSRSATLNIGNVTGTSLTVSQGATTQAYLINTIAGGPKVPRDGLPGTSVSLPNPGYAIADAAGNVYFSEPSLNAVYKLDTNGYVTRVAGGQCCYSGDGGPATSAQLNWPTGVALDSAGNLYIADSNNQRIRKVDNTGTITTVAGTGSSGYSGDGGRATNAQLNNPQGLATDLSNNLYISDSNNYRVRKVDITGTITTVAGTGAYGFSGDTGLATAAQITYPLGLATDSSSNLYIADSSNQRIRKVTASTGIITTVAGGTCCSTGDGGPATAAYINYPNGIAIDPAGNLYIADYGNQRIRKVAAATGVITTVAGNGNGWGYLGDGGSATSAQLANPQGVAVDGAGNLYIADSNNQRIRKVTASTGIITTVAGGNVGDSGPAVFAGLNYPRATALDGAGNLYVADAGNQRVRKIAPGGTITTIAGTGSCGFSGDAGPATSAQLCQPHGVAVDNTGANLYIADANNSRIRKVNLATGTITTIAGNGYGYSGDGGQATNAQLSNPTGVALDSSGNLYIADSSNYRVRKVNAATGIITTVAGNGTAGFGGDGGPATSALVSNPQVVAVDGAGNLYIADSNNSRIRKVDTIGTITTVAGSGYAGDGGPATSALLSYPQAVAVDISGNLYIADSGNQRIRRVDAAGTITTIAGNGNYGFSGDGGPAVNANFGNPVGITVDAAGNLYVADTNNNAIRMLTPENQPVLTVQSTHTGNFTVGQNSATYTLTASNAPGAPATSGTVTVTETLQSYLTLVSLSGSGWSCSGNTCTRGDTLAGGSNYPAITATVNVGASAPRQTTNAVTVSGGGAVTAGTTDSTVIAAPMTAVSVTPPSGSGTQQTFTLVYSDGAGASDISSAWVWFDNASASSSAQSCLAKYTLAGIYLLNDAGATFLGPVAMGSATPLSNSQCTLNAAASSVSRAGNNLTLNLAVSFAAGFAGPKNTKMHLEGGGGQNNPVWQTLGTWLTSPVVLSPVSVTPALGSGTQQTFTLMYSDTAGASDIYSSWVWFDNASASNSAHSCLAYLNPQTNGIYLLNDAGSAFLNPVALGSATPLSNSQCTINAAASTKTASSNNLTVNLAVTFASGYAGLKNTKMHLEGGGGQNNPVWQTMGTWTPVPIMVTPVSVVPSSGTGTQQTFALTYSDTAGANDIYSAWVWFDNASGSNSAHSCLAYYSGNSLYLLNDAGASFTGPVTIGSASTLNNAQCTLLAAASSASRTGNFLTVNLAVAFAGTYPGLKNTKMHVEGGAGQNNPVWQPMGTWTVPSTIVLAPVSVSPSSGSGNQQTFALTYSDTAGNFDISSMWVWFDNSTTSNSAHSCLAYYSPGTNGVYLLKDDASGFQGPVALGSANTLSNSQCTVNGPTATASALGNNRTLYLPVTFASAYSGLKNTKMHLEGGGGQNNPAWQVMGTWSMPGAPPVAPVSVTPQAGTGLQQTFTLVYTDPVGAMDISTAWVWFDSATSSSSVNSCTVYYNRPANTLYLLSDGAATWLNPVTMGSSIPLSNRGCSINAAASSATVSGNTLTLTLSVGFNASLAGQRNVKMHVEAGSGSSAWVLMGSWTVPGTVTLAPVSVTPATGAGNGNSQTFTLVYSDSVASSDIGSAWVWFDSNTASSASNSCLLYYSPQSNKLYLLNDAASAFLAPVLLGSSNYLNNSQCSVYAGSAAVSTAANTLTLSLPVTFPTSTFGGLKNVKMHLEGGGGQNNPVWQTMGVWSVYAYPTLTSISPTSVAAGSGSITLTATGSNFVSGANVQWSGPTNYVTLPATFVNSTQTQLQVTIPASLLTTSGTAQVSIINPGNVYSGTQTFTIN